MATDSQQVFFICVEEVQRERAAWAGGLEDSESTGDTSDHAALLTENMAPHLFSLLSLKSTGSPWSDADSPYPKLTVLTLERRMGRETLSEFELLPEMSKSSIIHLNLWKGNSIIFSTIRWK